MTNSPVPNPFITVDADAPDPSQLAPAVQAVRAGGFVVFPTETVYGVGILPTAADAAARLNALKGRSADQPLSVHLAPSADISAFAHPLAPLARRLLGAFTPGPLTLILPARGGGEVGLRIPAQAACAALLESVGGALLGTSANLTGDRAPVRAGEVSPELLSRVAAVIDAGPCRYAAASSVVRVHGDRPRILREGVISEGLLLEECGPVTLIVCTGNTCRSPLAAALLGHRLGERFRAGRARHGLPLPAVRSAGVAAFPGAAASPHAVRVAADRGLDLRSHRATHLEPALIETADFILAVSESAAFAVRSIAPNARAQIQVLNRELGGVPDPFGGSLSTYRACATALEEALDRFLEEHAERFEGTVE